MGGRRVGWGAEHRESVLDETLIRTMVLDLGTNLVMKLVDLFVTDAPARIVTLRVAVATGDGPRAAKIAHALKSASSSVGAAAFASRCGRVEQLAREGHPDLVADDVDCLDDDLVDARDALASVLASGPADQ